MTFWERFPLDIISHILGQCGTLHLRDLSRLARTSRHVQRIVYSDAVWSAIAHREGIVPYQTSLEQALNDKVCLDETGGWSFASSWRDFVVLVELLHRQHGQHLLDNCGPSRIPVATVQGFRTFIGTGPGKGVPCYREGDVDWFSHHCWGLVLVPESRIGVMWHPKCLFTVNLKNQQVCWWLSLDSKVQRSNETQQRLNSFKVCVDKEYIFVYNPKSAFRQLFRAVHSSSGLGQGEESSAGCYKEINISTMPTSVHHAFLAKGLLVVVPQGLEHAGFVFVLQLNETDSHNGCCFTISNLPFHTIADGRPAIQSISHDGQQLVMLVSRNQEMIRFSAQDRRLALVAYSLEHIRYGFFPTLWSVCVYEHHWGQARLHVGQGADENVIRFFNVDAREDIIAPCHQSQIHLLQNRTSKQRHRRARIAPWKNLDISKWLLSQRADHSESGRYTYTEPTTSLMEATDLCSWGWKSFQGLYPPRSYINGPTEIALDSTAGYVVAYSAGGSLVLIRLKDMKMCFRYIQSMVSAHMTVHRGRALLYHQKAAVMVDYGVSGSMSQPRIYPLMQREWQKAHHWMSSSYLIPQTVESIPRDLCIQGACMTDSAIYLYQPSKPVQVTDEPESSFSKSDQRSPAWRVFDLTGSAQLRFKPQMARPYYLDRYDETYRAEHPATSQQTESDK